MENQKRVLCPENEPLVSYMLQKRKELAEKPKGISEKLDATLSKAYNNVCCAKAPIRNLKELSQIKGVGKWILKQMQGYFDIGCESSEPEDSLNKGKCGRGTKRYVPQKNSVAYALLITLYRGTASGNEYMQKKELIDAAEASGLSRVPIGPEKGKGKPIQFGSSPRDWYSGWNCMKTLITKGLVIKSSCPAKYMLTEEGQETARECLMRSRLIDPGECSANVEGSSDVQTHVASDLESTLLNFAGESSSSVGLSRLQKSVDVPIDSLERFTRMGFSKEQVVHAFMEVSHDSQNKQISSLWPAVLCRLQEDQVYVLHSKPQTFVKDLLNSNSYTSIHDQFDASQTSQMGLTTDTANIPMSSSSSSKPASFNLRACSSFDCTVIGPKASRDCLSMPPLSYGEKFEDAYEIVLILDDREQFACHGSRGRKLIDNICKEHKIKILVRRLPVGDGIWVARHKYFNTEYVLDFIVERKKVDDLRSSITDNRYKDQKLRLLRCGLKRLIYLVEGDPNYSEASESIKTACFTTEILEGFDVQRTNSLPDTLQNYGYLTLALTHYYTSQLPCDNFKSTGICPPFDEFVKRCQDLDKMTVGDVFAVQLMQVSQVTEEVAMAILDLYPTLKSLAQAYSLLDGDACAQAEMLRKQSNNTVSAVASRNVFNFVWGDEI
ncbi:hypothetical protein K2173_025040 [Erythroxylum novogranatense]|uniref:Crossover junction endonuclease MUS81 n=1 Tax=Erythroxylum novogranatense TaxID=1862640 RepID=A0AAV8UD00_9ROSI|nr:hypothetical protein K2173_025040 [Erythroxylum novogranatense]